MARQLTNCCVSFQVKVQERAERCGKTPEEVFALWCEYCDACRVFDQSASLVEFDNWYAEQLKPAAGKAGA